MDTKQLPLISILLILVLASLSCSLFFPTAQPTQPPELYFGPTGGPLKIDPDVLPNAQMGVKYEAEIHILQNITPAGDISVSNGSLPPGLEFVFMDGEDAAKISGTPTEAGSFTFNISVWCFGTQVSGQTGEKEYSIVVK